MQKLTHAQVKFTNASDKFANTSKNLFTPAYDETPCVNDALKERLPDDCQRRAQLKKSFKEGRITTEDLDAVKQFARNYLVTERQALDFLRDLQELEFKKTKRSEQRSAQKHVEKQADKSPEQGISKQGKGVTEKASSKRKRETAQVTRKKRARYEHQTKVMMKSQSSK